MALTLGERLRGAWDVARGRYDHDISTEIGRWKGRFFAATIDHGFLRRRWRNEGLIAPGIYRANHPDARMLARWKSRGIVEVISLRAASGAVHKFEAETCEALGLRLHSVNLAARSAPNPMQLLRLLDLFDAVERPALVHCKSGADRTGLAAAMWKIHVEGCPVAEAKRALGFRHLHIKSSKTGVLDRVLEAYEARLERGPIPLRAWIEQEYDPAQVA